MIDKRIGKRIKEQREAIGLTQEEFAEKIGVATNYISTIERGASFPRCEKLIAIINGLECSADAIFCDVIKESHAYRTSILSEMLSKLPAEEQDKILAMVDLMIRQSK
jgi:transcriptional regulator with XRE-family HTH domain